MNEFYIKSKGGEHGTSFIFSLTLNSQCVPRQNPKFWFALAITFIFANFHHPVFLSFDSTKTFSTTRIKPEIAQQINDRYSWRQGFLFLKR